MHDDIFLTPEELADRWKITVNNLSMRRFRGEGPKFVKLGAKGSSSTVRYKLSDILEFERN